MRSYWENIKQQTMQGYTTDSIFRIIVIVFANQEKVYLIEMKLFKEKTKKLNGMTGRT